MGFKTVAEVNRRLLVKLDAAKKARAASRGVKFDVGHVNKK
jgi:hypothetical protein